MKESAECHVESMNGVAVCIKITWEAGSIAFHS